MGRPSLDRVPITARIPRKLFESVKKDALSKGYKAMRGKGFRVDWQGYLTELFALVVSEKVEIPERKG